MDVRGREEPSTYGFHYKCPLCGEIDWYEMPIESFNLVIENQHKVIMGRCGKCGKTWAKYAYVVFGGDVDG